MTLSQGLSLSLHFLHNKTLFIIGDIGAYVYGRVYLQKILLSIFFDLPISVKFTSCFGLKLPLVPVKFTRGRSEATLVV